MARDHEDDSVQVMIGGFPDRPAREAALSRALLTRVASEAIPPTLRIYRPGPTVAFGRLDRARRGYPRAVASAREAGFVPVLRAPGGHVAAYDEETIAFDWVIPVADALIGREETFRDSSSALARELAALGVDARVGAVDGEYCRGDFSVNARGQVKLIGTAQRAVRGATLLAGFLTVSGPDRLRAVLSGVYSALGLDWDPNSVGSLETEVGAITLADAERAVIAALAPGHDGATASLDNATLALAVELEPKHAI